MAQFLQGTANTAVKALLERGAIKNEFVAEMFDYLTDQNLMLNVNFEQCKRDYEMKCQDFERLQKQLQNKPRTISVSSDDGEQGESKTNDEFDEINKDKLMIKWYKTFDWHVPNPQKNDFQWIKNTLENPEPYRKSHINGKKYREKKKKEAKQENITSECTNRDDDKSPWRP